EGYRLRLGTSGVTAPVMQRFVLLQLLLDLGLGITARANQVFLGIVQSVLQQRKPGLCYLQLLLNGVSVVLAGIGGEFRKPAGLFLYGLKPAIEKADSRVEIFGLAVFDRRVELG